MAHFLVGLLILIAHRRDPAIVGESAFIATLVDFGTWIFPVIENAYRCKPPTRVGVAMVALPTLSAQLVLLTMLMRDWRSVLRAPTEKVGLVTIVRMILIAAFGIFTYYYTFFVIGSPALTPGYKVICIEPGYPLWLVWSSQTFVAVLVTHLCWPFLITTGVLIARRLKTMRPHDGQN